MDRTQDLSAIVAESFAELNERNCVRSQRYLVWNSAQSSKIILGWPFVSGLANVTILIGFSLIIEVSRVGLHGLASYNSRRCNSVCLGIKFVFFIGWDNDAGVVGDPNAVVRNISRHRGKYISNAISFKHREGYARGIKRASSRDTRIDRRECSLICYCGVKLYRNTSQHSYSVIIITACKGECRGLSFMSNVK